MKSSMTIQEIKKKLLAEQLPSASFLEELRADERKGVQNLLARYAKQEEEREEQKRLYHEKYKYERSFCPTCTHMAGIDEAGRGPLAGPVTAAAVILPESFTLPGLNDSKILTREKRGFFYEKIMAQTFVGIGWASAREIDKINIYEASRKAMVRALESLPHSPDYLLIDAMEVPVAIPQTSLVKGDAKSVSIAAASIIAKETRDAYMKQVHMDYPAYGFPEHAGYGTRRHLEALDTYGPCPEHRRSFRPVAERIS